MSTRYSSATVTLPSEREILITRAFEAPLELMWEVLTEPRHLLRWWGPPTCPLVACEVDLRVGGSWRYVCREESGEELGWHGTYVEIEAPRRVVSTEVFEGVPDAAALTTMTLTHEGGVTTLRTLVVHESRANRDGHISSGMEPGMQATFDRLDDLLAIADRPAERFRRVAGRFGDRVAEVPASAWERPAPCDGWVARDVVRHLVEWIPGFLRAADVTIVPGPSVDADPAGAWDGLSRQLQALLDDPAESTREFDAGPPGRMTVETAIDRLMTGDILIHTWDLARATGLDETIDAGIAAEMLHGMQPLDEVLRQSGHYGPKVEVADTADDCTKLIAFTGRSPGRAAPAATG